MAVLALKRTAVKPLGTVPEWKLALSNGFDNVQQFELPVVLL